MDVFDGFQKLQKVLPLLFLPLLFWDLIPRGYILQVKKQKSLEILIAVFGLEVDLESQWGDLKQTIFLIPLTESTQIPQQPRLGGDLLMELEMVEELVMTAIGSYSIEAYSLAGLCPLEVEHAVG